MNTKTYALAFSSFANLINSLFEEAASLKRAVLHESPMDSCIDVEDRLQDLRDSFGQCCQMNMSGQHHYLEPAEGFVEYLLSQGLKFDTDMIQAGFVSINKEGLNHTLRFDFYPGVND